MATVLEYGARPSHLEKQVKQVLPAKIKSAANLLVENCDKMRNNINEHMTALVSDISDHLNEKISTLQKSENNGRTQSVRR